MGVMADSVRQVIDLKQEDVEHPPTFGTRVKVDYLLGMARSGKKFCLILDTDKILSTDELLNVSHAMEDPVPDAEVLPVSDAVAPPEPAEVKSE
jgi:purine-binding chemotaxis protein CheW